MAGVADPRLRRLTLAVDRLAGHPLTVSGSTVGCTIDLSRKARFGLAVGCTGKALIAVAMDRKVEGRINS